ncbi:MAG: prolipoprotein diacylglyceryl transferase [Candidatus Woesearchaeota archaeon]
MFTSSINPILFSIGPLDIRYYGLFYVIGFIFSYFLFSYLAKERKIKMKQSEVADFFVYIIIGSIAGARLFYAIIYNPMHYIHNLLDLFAVWKGGMSFHGGLVGGVLAAYIFIRKKKLDFYEIADIAVIPLVAARGLGRIGNFINGELYGRITNVWWSVKFPTAEGFRHPSQLYEAFKNLLIFNVLFFIRNIKLPKGTIFWLFVFLTGAFRFIIEFFREPDPQLGFIIGWLTMGQILSILMVIASAIFLTKLIYISKTH